MNMPKDCFECNFAVDGLCVAMNPVRNRDWKAKETTNYCPLTEYETTDRITLKRAMSDDGYKEVGMVAVMDPLRPINVKMDTFQLYKIIGLLRNM